MAYIVAMVHVDQRAALFYGSLGGPGVAPGAVKYRILRFPGVWCCSFVSAQIRESKAINNNK